MRCLKCAGCLMWSEEYVRCLNCGLHAYPPLPSTPIRTLCYYCHVEAPTPGKVSCATCDEKGKAYRKAHPRARRKIGPTLPVVTEVKT